MIGLDTNVLVRYLVQDEPIQSKQAARLIEHSCTADAPGWINLVVLCELVWVLTSGYGYTRDAIADVLAKLLQVTELLIEADDAVVSALQLYRSSKVDFADALIGIRNRQVGCEITATFDRAASAIDEFAAVPRLL
ncbi:MAG: type II toxin-antitoxin system VapC family toxin [Proteobacteria bacterium]|nr:type II toxin-antitoxin system VapC family toxin [Pseudomonadota bacterium]